MKLDRNNQMTDLDETAAGFQPLLEENFIDRAGQKVAKGFRPDYVRFASIPVNFKGALLVPELKRAFAEFLSQNRKIRP
jgi:hypothetical protein